MDAYFKGTVGKKVMRLEVINTHARPKLLTAFYRNMLKVFVLALVWPTHLIFLGKQGFHNSATQCKVLEVPLP